MRSIRHATCNASCIRFEQQFRNTAIATFSSLYVVNTSQMYLMISYLYTSNLICNCIIDVYSAVIVYSRCVSMTEVAIIIRNMSY